MNRSHLLLALGVTLSSAAASAQSDAPDARVQRPLLDATIVESFRAPRHVDRHTPPRAIPAPRPQYSREGATDGGLDQGMLESVVASPRTATLHHDVAMDGSLWARGADYKASAGAHGFTFIPFLGSEAPQNYPVTMSLSGARRGANELELSNEPSARREGDRWSLDRGAIEVRYDLMLGGAEQSFLLDVPTGAGDLELFLDVTTELSLRRDGAAFRFENDLGGVNYGAAVVFDANGERADVQTRRTGEGLALTVPAEFLEVAESPILVDPVMSSFAIDTLSAELYDPDLAYDAVSDQHCVVYVESFSASDRDLYSVFINAANGAVSNGAYVEMTSVNWTEPRIAQQAYTRRFLIVATADELTQANRSDIGARFREADGTLDPPFALKGGTTAYNTHSPDIGGEAVLLANSYFCLVYNRDYGVESDVWAIIVDADGNWLGGEIPLATSTTRNEASPEVGRSSGSGNVVTRFNIAWTIRDLSTGHGRVEAAQLSYNGGTLYGPHVVTPFSSTSTYFDIDVSSPSDKLHPLTNQPYYVVAFDDAPSAVEDGYVALCSGTNTHSVAQIQRLENADIATTDQNAVRVATTPDHFVIGYEDASRLMVTVVQPIVNDLGITERRLVSTGAVPVNAGSTMSVCSTFDGGANYDDAMFVFQEFGSGGTLNIHGARAEAAPMNVSGYQFCHSPMNSTGDGGFIQAFGDGSPTSPQGLAVSNLPLNSFGFLLAARLEGNVPNAGGSQGTLCLGGHVGRFGIFNTLDTGTAHRVVDPQAIPHPTGTVAALAGQTWRFQSWHRDAVGGMATSNFTNAVAIPFM